MKKTFLFLLIHSMFFFSCNSDVNPNRDNDTSAQPTLTTWQQQLEYAKNKKRTTTRTGANELSLVEYTYRGTINSEAEIPELIKEFFSEESAFALNGIVPENLVILPIKTIMQDAELLFGYTGDKQSLHDFLFANLIHQLEAMITVGMELIDLEWSYKGDTFYSTAVASNDLGGIVFESIGCLILESVEKTRVEKTTPMVYTRAKSVGVNRFFEETGKARNNAGIAVAEWTITCTSTFNEYGILTYRQLFHYSKPLFLGWSCGANIATVSGTIDVSKFHEFAWAYAYGSFTSISLTFNGISFTLSGGGTLVGESDIHRGVDLMTDPCNCGAEGNTCPPGHECIDGECVMTKSGTAVKRSLWNLWRR